MLKDERAKEIVRQLAEFLDSGVEEEGIVLYDYLLERLTKYGLAGLIEAGQAMRENIGAYAVALNANPFKQADTSRAIRGCVDGLQAWDAALEALAGASGATKSKGE